MIVVNDLCGDEDSDSLDVVYLTKYIQDSLYKALLSPYETGSIKVVESQYRKVLTDVYTKEGYDPQVKCELQQDGKIKVNFLCPQWVADRINENDLS